MKTVVRIFLQTGILICGIPMANLTITAFGYLAYLPQFFIGWIAGMFGLVAYYSSACRFNPEVRPLRFWEVMGLIVGITVSLPALLYLKLSSEGRADLHWAWIIYPGVAALLFYSLKRTKITPDIVNRLQVLTLDLPNRTHAEQAEFACRGGAKWIQFRTKTLSGKARIAEAKAVVSVCRAHGAICIINDSPELALACGADGVHLGKEDMSPVEARDLLGPRKIIGVTVNFPEDAERVVREGVADYAGVGPWRFTTSKAKLAPVLAPEALRALIATMAPLPCVVIGGVTVADVSAIRALGAHGVAVSSGIVAAEDPAKATREFLRGL